VFIISNVRNPVSIKLRDSLLISKLFFVLQNSASFSVGFSALLALRVGVPIIPAYINRDKNNHHTISVLPEIPLQQEDDHEKFMLVNTQIMIDWIASILVKHPTEWLWLHNRWKRAKTK
jgi:lauroyl/myristoyl acyltransferase